MNQQPEVLTNLELLSRSWYEIKERFVSLYILSFLAPLAIWLVNGLCFGFNPISLAQQQPSIVFSLFTSFFAILLGVWGSAALVLFICKRVSSIQEALGLAVTRLGRLLAFWFLIALVAILSGFIISLPLFLLSAIGSSNLLFGLCIILLSLVFLILLIGAFSFFILVPYVLILTNMPFFQAIKYSVCLVKKRYLKTLGFLGLLILGSFVASIVFGVLLILPQFIVFTIAPSLQWVFSLAWVFVSSLISLFIVLPLTAYYLNAVQEEKMQENQEDPKETEPSVNKANKSSTEQDEDGPVIISNIR